MALDPRSYPAKSVLQRMAIISAGVIMNLIFAVVFATAAYYLGVKYMPCVIGSSQPGSPGWEAGLMPGDMIVQLGKDLPKSETLRFDHDLSYRVAKAGLKKPLDMLVRRVDGNEEWVQVQPRLLHKADKKDRPRVGISPGIKNRIAVDDESSVSSAKNAGLKTNDEIVSVEVDGAKEEISDPNQVQALLARYPDRELSVTVKRHGDLEAEQSETLEGTPKDAELVTMQLSPQPSRSFGMVMKMGAVEAIRRNSPAEAAGLKMGDMIVSLDGAPVGDPLRLEGRLLARIGEPVKIQVERKNGDGGTETQEVSITPVAPRMYTEMISPGKPIAIETLGVAIAVRDTVESVEPGSPAEKGGIVAGDRVTSVKFVAKEGAIEIEKKLKESVLRDPAWAFTTDRDDWGSFQLGAVQAAPDGADVEFTVERGGEDVKVVLSPSLDSSLASSSRGFAFLPLTKIRKADDLTSALQLGFRETKEGVLQVVDILRNIGSLFKSVGGPIAIATIGTQEAQEGLPRLLIFLTMLSANLAVLNFLPIPVLDGGHMVFLAYEGLMGKPVNERVIISLTMVGMALLLGLMAFVIGKDILWLAGV